MQSSTRYQNIDYDILYKKGDMEMVLGIYGAGGLGREVKDIAELLGSWDEIIFIDDTVPSGGCRGIKRISFDRLCQIYDKEEIEIVIALGEPEYKIALYEKVKEKGYKFANVIHPTVGISPSARLGRGLIIKAYVYRSCDTIIADTVRIEPVSAIGPECRMGVSSQISSGVTVGGHCEIGAGTYVGLTVPIRENTKIGCDSVIGMGSVVQRDIPEDVIALGNPARVIRKKDGDKVFH